MSEHKNEAPKQEQQYSLNDDRRVKVLSPGALVARRFFRNRLAVIGLSILIAMFLFSFLGVKVGSTFGAKYQSKAELIGGVILVLMGVKILLEHLLGG